jgi:hypothetical protein
MTQSANSAEVDRAAGSAQRKATGRANAAPARAAPANETPSKRTTVAPAASDTSVQLQQSGDSALATNTVPEAWTGFNRATAAAVHGLLVRM